MRLLVLACLLGWVDLGHRAPASTAALAQFAFLVGCHAVAVEHYDPDAGAWTPFAQDSAWNGRWALNGGAIYEEFFVDGLSESRTIRTFDPETGVWRISSSEEDGMQEESFRAFEREGLVVREPVDSPRSGLWRAEYERLGDGRWRQTQYERAAPEDAWVPTFALTATPVACP